MRSDLFGDELDVVADLTEVKGDAEGHAFHGNRYTGGIGGGDHEPARMHPAKLTVEEMRAFGQILQKDAAPPKEIKQQEYMMLAGKFLMAEQDADNVATTTAGERTPEFLAALRFEELKEAMGEYETADAWLLNMELRGGTDPAELSMSSHSVAEMDEAVKEFGQHFDEDKVVFRGAIMDHIPQVGEVYHDEAFVSTIPDAYEAVNCCSAGYANVVSMQAAPVDGASVVWEINIPAGTDVVAARPSEYKESSPFLEVLLGRGANLRIEQTGTRKGVTFVKATYLGSQPKPSAPRSRKAAAPAVPPGRAWRVLWLPGNLKAVEADQKGAHDVSGEPRDEHGEWTAGGGGMKWEEAVAKIRNVAATAPGTEGTGKGPTADPALHAATTTTDHPRYFYHSSAPKNHESILKTGLEAGRSLGGKQSRVYLSLEEPERTTDYSPRDKYRVDTQGLPLRPDPEAPHVWAISEVDIPPDRIEHLWTTFNPRDQKGDVAGHGFHGNRYTGGIGGGEHGHATFTPPPEELGRLGTKTLLAKRVEAEKAAGLTHEWGGTNEQEFASNLKAHIMQTVARESGLSPERVDSFTKTWARSSTDSVADSVAMQQAIATKFNLPMGSYLQERAEYMRSGYRKDLLTTRQVEEIGRKVKAFNEEANQRLTGQRSEVGQILPPTGGGVEGTQASHDFFEAIHQQDAMLEPLNLHNAAIEASIENGDDYSKFDQSEQVNQNLGKEVDPDLVTPYKVAFAAYQDSGINYTVDARNLFRGEGADEAMSFDQRVADAQKYVDEVYKETQFTLKNVWGVKYLALDRGMSLKEAPPKTFTKIDFDANPLSSWSADARVALRFAYHDVTSDENSPNPWWLKANIPVENVFSIPSIGPGCYNENEVVCIKGDYEVMATEGPAPA